MPPRHLIKTDAGRSEIRNRSLPLSRAARNLLLIIDDGHDADYWLGLVRGCAESDLQHLVDAGLVAPSASNASAPGQRIDPVSMALAASLQATDFRHLYDNLTAQARPRLGLINGYLTILAVERAADLDALREVARQFVDQIRKLRGDAVAMTVVQALTPPNPPTPPP